ncbi:hypothetical protein TNCV_1027251 [Trichonephila clavipes]|nr:hypothetical protein TNCV_1027251 [Trichonephila clavipes]
MHTKFVTRNPPWRLGRRPNAYEFCRLILKPVQNRTNGNAELICDVTNVSMSIFLDCSVTAQSAFLSQLCAPDQAAANPLSPIDCR